MNAQDESTRPKQQAPFDAAEQRRLRSAQKLRENLARRKQQARARRAGEADLVEGLPAAPSRDGES
jgi:hypothetical protein